MRLTDHPFASISRHISDQWPISKRHIQDMNVRVRFRSLFSQNFPYPGNRLADVVLEFIHGLPLRIAAREGWNLCPKSALRVFVDNNSVLLHILILPQWPTGVSIPRSGDPHGRVVVYGEIGQIRRSTTRSGQC